MRGRTYCFLAKNIPHTGFQLPAGCPAGSNVVLPAGCPTPSYQAWRRCACRCWAAVHGQLSLPNSTAEEALASVHASVARVMAATECSMAWWHALGDARDRCHSLVTIHAKARTCRMYGPVCSHVVPPCPTAYGGLRMCRSRIPSSPEGGTRPHRRAASPAGQGRPVLYALAGSCYWLVGVVRCTFVATRAFLAPASLHARRTW
jgi:hypothetical protein